MRNWMPLNSRTTAKETLSPSTLPSEMGASPICPMVIVPLSLSPSTFNVKVFSIVPFGVSIEAFQVPEASAASAAREHTAINAKIQRDFIVCTPSPASVPSLTPLCINSRQREHKHQP